MCNGRAPSCAAEAGSVVGSRSSDEGARAAAAAGPFPVKKTAAPCPARRASVIPSVEGPNETGLEPAVWEVRSHAPRFGRTISQLTKETAMYWFGSLAARAAEIAGANTHSPVGNAA